MKRWIVAMIVLGIAAVAFAADPTIKQIMQKAHKPGTGLLTEIGASLKMDEPDWDEIQSHTKDLIELGKGLSKNDPPKGDKASWEKYTKGYVDLVTALDTAAKKKDRKGAQAIHTQINMACKDCHQAHQKK